MTDKLDKMAATVNHLEAISDKLWDKETDFSPIERALLFSIVRAKIWSIAEEAAPLLLPKQKNRRGRPTTGVTENTKLRDIAIAQEFHNLYDPDARDSEGVYRALVDRCMSGRYTDSKRNMVMRSKRNGEQYIQEMQETAATSVMNRLHQNEESRRLIKERNNRFFEGMEELETIKY